MSHSKLKTNNERYFNRVLTLSDSLLRMSVKVKEECFGRFAFIFTSLLVNNPYKAS